MPHRVVREGDVAFRAELGGRIARARERINLTQRQFSNALGYSSGWSQKAETGENALAVTDLMAISKLTGTPIELLLGTDDRFMPKSRGDFAMLFPDTYEAEALWYVSRAIRNARTMPANSLPPIGL